ncbi:MAG: A/G-specific adenine glycosylase [Coxiella sp. (in: Bacteria)]|nr:MAG: A/G-specific adenine glycosylase [Coxiella sp. (in: g-proteobacteria)]
MVKKSTLKGFSKSLIKWYQQHGRFDLPWQKNQTAYRVWISEIMLQQTQVATVIPYYQRFMQSFPNVKQLAQADEDQVLSHWSGLGYYARARNLHKTAKHIHNENKGRFPRTVDALEALPGIGASTAGAILSFAYQLPTVICDGNVKRVLARLFAIDKPKQTTEAHKLFWDIATQLTPNKNTHLYNQAIMDLGATLCTRSKPRCDDCPFENQCQAHALNQETAFPVSKKKKPNPTKRLHMVILQNEQGEVLLEKRPTKGIWGGLWSFPECELDIDVKQWCQTAFGVRIRDISELDVIHHKFSHFNLEINPLLISIKQARRETPVPAQQHWHHPSRELPGGICSPVITLLDLYAGLDHT